VASSKPGIQELTRALDTNEALVAVHYACESFLTAKDHPAGVACAALYDLQTGETFAFSRSDAPPSVTGQAREIHLLDRFYEQVNARFDARFLHWNMNRPEYGFGALAARYEYLTGKQPSDAVPERRVDVDELFTARFGYDYAPHPKLESVARLNDLDLRSFRSGKSEAELFAKEDWGTITRSTASKAKIIGELLTLLATGKVRTSDSAGSVTFAGERLDAVSVVFALGDSMLPVQRSLSVRPQKRPALEVKDEYDDQYLFRALLVQFFDDVRDEDFAPSYAGGNSRIDFVLPQYKLAVELKHTRAGLKDKDLGEQLMIDRDRYQGRDDPPATHLLCLVFDHDGLIRNPRAIEADLRRDNTAGKMAATVRIYDR
jgi:REase_DpnII-MboI